MVAPKSTPIAAVVSFYGLPDLPMQFDHMPIPQEFQSFFGVGENSAESEGTLRRLSPRYMVHKDLPAFLLLHGTADELLSNRPATHCAGLGDC